MKMKKLFSVFFLVLLFFSLNPSLALAGKCDEATPIVQCGETEPCTLVDFFGMIIRVIQFIIWCITPYLLVLMLTIGGVVLLVSGGNPGLQSTGKKIIFTTLIGAFIVYGAYLIIDLIVSTIGAGWIQSWFQLPGS